MGVTKVYAVKRTNLNYYHFRSNGRMINGPNKKTMKPPM